MADTKLVPISGVCQPSSRMRRIATALHGPNFAASIDSMVTEAGTVNFVADAIGRALEAGTSKDGRVDLRDAALHLIKEMRRNQR